MSQIFSYRLDPSQKVLTATVEDALKPDALSWIHLSGWSSHSAQELLVDRLGVARALAEAATETMASQRPVHRSDSLAFTLSLPFESRDSCRVALVGVIASGTNVITLSASQCRLIPNLINMWEDDPEGVGLTPARLLFSIIDEVADSYIPLSDDIHNQIEQLEEEVFEEKVMGPAAALCIKKELLGIRREAGPLRDTLQGLIRYGEPWAPRDLALDYQDTLSHVMRTIESLDIARDILSSIMDAQVAMAGNRLNLNMRILTVISTILMTASLIAGIYGMNLKLTPAPDSPWGFPLALLLMAASGAGAWAVFRAKKWV